MTERKKVAAIVTTYFPHSHADLIVSKFVEGFPTGGGLIEPSVDLVSMYVDQPHPDDVGMEVARKHGVDVYPSIRSALTLTPPSAGHWPTASDWKVGELAVDGVLIIGEHGDYSGNERGRQMYPRRHFFEQVCGIFATSGRAAPVFNDKHLAHSWADCVWMYERAAELGAPFMAGSALPVADRAPELDHEVGAPIEEALSLGYFHPYVNGLDSYGFHGLEALQCMVERRRGGETGIRAVQCIEGGAVWAAGRDGLWPRDLADAAEAQIRQRDPGRMEDNCANPAVFLLEYLDGLRAAALMLDGHLKGFGYAARVDGETHGAGFNATGSRHMPFSYLGLNIQEMFLTGRPQYPVERTLLVSGALDALMESRYRGHVRIETPHLRVAYSPPERPPARPCSPQRAGPELTAASMN